MSPSDPVKKGNTLSSDASMLDSLLKDERLDETEREAFEDMSGLVSRGVKLSKKQKDWIERRWRGLELDAEEGSANLYSSGKVDKTGGDKVQLPWEKPGYVKVLKPPSRQK